jgi:hypothetical protein
MNKRAIHIILALAFLLIGVTVYYYFKKDVLVYESYLGVQKTTGISSSKGNSTYSKVGKHISSSEKNVFTENLANWLPDLCWEVSFLLMLTAIWGNWQEVPKILKFATFVVIIGSEVLQGMGLVPGTGDLMDILVYFIGFTIFILLHSKQRAKM